MPSTKPSSNDAPSTTATAGIARSLLPDARKTLSQQIKALADVDVRSLPTDATQLPTIVSGQRRFVLERFFATRKVRTSWVCQYGTFIVEMGVSTADGKLPAFWCCSFCNKLYNAAATSSAMAHLNEVYNKTESGDTIRPQARSVWDLLQQEATAASTKTPVVRSLAIQFEETLVDWLVDANIPFSGVDNPFFRKLLSLVDAEACEALLPGQTTVRRWVEARYLAGADQLRKQLASSLYNIHLSFDIWTSPNCFALLGVVGHFVEDSTYRLETRLLGIYSPHSVVGKGEGCDFFARAYQLRQQKRATRVNHIVEWAMAPRFVVLDEFHTAKDGSTKVYKALNQMRKRAPVGHGFKLAALSATPITVSVSTPSPGLLCRESSPTCSSLLTALPFRTPPWASSRSKHTHCPSG